MPMVTDKQYYMSNFLVDNLNFCVERQKVKWDNLIIIDGDEGAGKSTFSWGVGYYLAWKTGTTFNVDNIFFDPNEMLEFATRTTKQVIVWDEAAIEGLASNWQSKFQKKLLKIMMVARKKRHFWIFIIPQFFRLNNYLAVDRSFILINVNSPDNIHRGRFFFFNKTQKNKMYEYYLASRKKAYTQNYSFVDKFTTDYMNIIDVEAYEKKKDEAILSIDKQKAPSKSEINARDRANRFAAWIGAIMIKYNLVPSELAKLTGYSRSEFGRWRKYVAENPRTWREEGYIEQKIKPGPGKPKYNSDMLQL